jgi:predicted lipid-binding transport protein (Tim44 family)
MKRWFVVVSLAACSLALVAPTADAKRLGGGGTSGMKRDVPARTAPDTVPAKPASPGNASAATPAAPGAAAAAAAPKRSWLGPVAGLAAGLGLAALFSHLGLGDELANFVMLALLAVVAVFAIRWLMRRFAPTAGRPLASANGMPFAASNPAGKAASSAPAWNGTSGSGTALGTAAVAPSAAAAMGRHLPEGFDAVEFQRLAKMIFIRLQAANDAADLNDLRNFTTPELFASLRLDLQERGPSAQQTDVVQIDAEVIDFAEEADRQIVSVRFHGLIRELAGDAASDFDEVWHLVKPVNGSQWAIAGIQQTATA